ncbi:TetR family transcriptional regulator [Kutzneria viridogrisea]
MVHALTVRSDTEPDGQTFLEAARRAQILRATAEVIAELGYAKTSLARIARQIGVSKGVILYHFTDKDSLIRALIWDVYERGAAAIGAAVSREHSASGKLRAYISANLEFTAAHRLDALALVELGSSYRTPEGLRLDQLAEQAMPLPHGLAALDLLPIFQEGLRSGEFREFEPAAMGIAVRSAIDSAGNCLSRDPGFDVRAFAAELVTTFDLATRRPT